MLEFPPGFADNKWYFLRALNQFEMCPSISFRPSSVPKLSPSRLNPPIHASRLVCSSSQVYGEAISK